MLDRNTTGFTLLRTSKSILKRAATNYGSGRGLTRLRAYPPVSQRADTSPLPFGWKIPANDRFSRAEGFSSGFSGADPKASLCSRCRPLISQ